MNQIPTLKGCFALGALTLIATASAEAKSAKRPNILLAIADDMSYPFASAYGAKCVNTPAFDRVAKMGVLCNNGYVTSPGSSPSRASLLTGKFTWQIEEAGTHNSAFPAKFTTYTELLAQAGYAVGYGGKGWSPGDWRSYRKENPAGPEYNDIRLEKPTTGIWDYDYFENFKYMLEQKREQGQPFCFWYGGKEAHRGYEKDSHKRFGKSIAEAEVPAHLPDTPIVRGDVMDYAVEVEWFDSHLGRMIDYLESIGELENTIIVVTADNGMPFPAAKANCFDPGVHVPLAICMGDRFFREGAADEVISTVDLAATFLDLAGVEIPKDMTSRSLVPWLEGRAKSSDVAYFARERHAHSRYQNWSYPMRAVRMGDWVYIRNFEPSRWPAGDPTMEITKGGVTKVVTAYTDIDGSPSKSELISRRDDPAVAPYFVHATAKRPAQQLYNIKEDRTCMCDLAGDPKYRGVVRRMDKVLMERLRETGDTRLTTPEVWDGYAAGGQNGRRFAQ